jgi:hypothetical protein
LVALLSRSIAQEVAKMDRFKIPLHKGVSYFRTFVNKGRVDRTQRTFDIIAIHPRYAESQARSRATLDALDAWATLLERDLVDQGVDVDAELTRLRHQEKLEVNSD